MKRKTGLEWILQLPPCQKYRQWNWVCLSWTSREIHIHWKQKSGSAYGVVHHSRHVRDSKQRRQRVTRPAFGHSFNEDEIGFQRALFMSNYMGMGHVWRTQLKMWEYVIQIQYVYTLTLLHINLHINLKPLIREDYGIRSL